MAIALHQLILCVSVLPYRIFPMPIVQIILFFPSFCKATERCRHIALFSCGQVYLPYCSLPPNTFSELTLRLFGVVPPQNGSLPPLFSRLAQSRIFPICAGMRGCPGRFPPPQNPHLAAQMPTGSCLATRVIMTTCCRASTAAQ